MYGNEGNAKNRDKFKGPCRLISREKKKVRQCTDQHSSAGVDLAWIVKKTK